jgi:hypothetical protein
MSKFFSVLLITAFIAGIFAGCGGKLEETYRMVTLREAGQSGIVSPGFKFGLDTPKFIAVNGNIGLVREGNLIEFFTGRDLENKVKSVEGRKFIAGVRKAYSPRVHFIVDFFVAGNDTIHVGEPGNVKFPALVRGFDEGQFEDVDVDALTASTRELKNIYDTQFKVPQAKLTYEEVEIAGQPMMAYIVSLNKVRFVIQDVDPAMELILKAIIAENIYFNGGLSFGGAPSEREFPRSFRDRTNIGGFAKIKFVKYAGETVPATES